MNSFDLRSILTFQENNIELDLLCSNGYNNDSYETNTHLFSEFFNDNMNFESYSEPFNENFDLLPHFELPFNDNFTDINILLNSETFSNDSSTNINILQNPKLLSNSDFTDVNILPSPKSFFNDNNLTSNSYQYNLAVGDYFDDWTSVDTLMHKYCLERGFGYQICRSDKDKDPNDFTIRRKSFKCSSSSIYEARKVVDQTLH